MEKLTILLLIIILIALFFLYRHGYISCSKSEKFNNTQNYIPTNKNDIANLLQYGKADNLPALNNQSVNSTMGPSSQTGVGKNSDVDVYDNRGYKWAYNANTPEVDVFTSMVDNAQLRNNFERTYLLDPNGSLAQYDITNNKISPNCCPAQYAPPFKTTDSKDDGENCDYAQKYVANNYSGMNFEDGYGCVCMTPGQADFYGSRGGNTD